MDYVCLQLCYCKGVMMKEQRAACALLLFGLCVSSAHDEGPLMLSLEHMHQNHNFLTVTPLFTVMQCLSPSFYCHAVPARAFPLSQPSCVALLIPMGTSSILHLLAPVVSEPVISGDATCSPVSAVDFVFLPDNFTPWDTAGPFI